MTTPNQTITIAYSPDTDDSFMMLPLKNKLIPWGDYAFEFYRDDIQELNEKAKEGHFDITAISIAAFPNLAEQYWLAPVGASIGQDYGPAVVVPAQSEITLDDLKGKTIAVPGLQTSAFFASLSLLPEYNPLPMHFENISAAVLAGTVDAGVLIHERQLTYEQEGLKKIGDLGKLWREKFSLPLPLGANAIHKRFDRDQANELTRILRESIEYAFRHRDDTLRQAVEESNKADVVNPTEADTYINMYVNDDSLDFSHDVRSAIEILFANAAEKNLCPKINLSESTLEVTP